VLRAFAILNRSEFNVILKLQLTDKQYKELNELTHKFMRYHMPDIFSFRGQKIMDQLLETNKS
ncbi:MAG: hypothetical protein OXF06_13035, partial [Bacteroidetes bacterium]|nr:hypothetical protein [Bacteroidota bacterium]